MARRGIPPAIQVGLLVGAVAAVAGLVAGARFRHLTAVERGARLAQSEGCFACHGPGGVKGTANAGHPDGYVPSFTGGTPMMYAKTVDEVRAWIRDGITSPKRASAVHRQKTEAGTLRMPAFKERLSVGQIEDLVAYVRAVSTGWLPEDSTLIRGIAAGRRLGCFGCHGPMGVGTTRNPGSLKGYVAGWNGEDFAELCRDSSEFRGWVREGVAPRLKENAAARFFLRRGVLKMPAFKDRVTAADLRVLWAYIEALRTRAELAWAR